MSMTRTGANILAAYDQLLPLSPFAIERTIGAPGDALECAGPWAMARAAVRVPTERFELSLTAT
jgi:hypothetical protein